MQRKLFAILFLFGFILNTHGRAQGMEEQLWDWDDELGIMVPQLRFNFSYYSKSQVIAAKPLWLAIAQELKQSKLSDWAGEYDLPGADVHNSILRWAPQSGFVMLDIHTCYSTVTNVRFGQIKIKGGLIQLLPEQQTLVTHQNPHSSHFLPTKWVTVKWGQAHYLVPENELAIFCSNDVAGLGIPDKDQQIDYAYMLVKRDDQKREIKGLPQLPSQYAHLVKKPIQARIIKVGKTVRIKVPDEDNPWWDHTETLVTLNAGAKLGVKLGMRFGVVASEDSESVVITKVGKHIASGIIERSVRKKPGEKINQWDDGQDKPDPPIKVGWRLATAELR